MKNTWLILFFILSVLQLAGIATDMEALRHFTKPLLMPILGLWLAGATSGNPSALRTGWLTGLFFSTIGDTLLMFKGSSFFLGGLGAFLLAHLSYIGGITAGLREKRGFLLKNSLWVIPFALYPVFLLTWLWPDIPPGMRAAVGIYALVIATMAMSIANLYGFIPRAVFWLLLAGALLFILSDSLIAVNQFGHPFAGGSLAVMVTYLVGQYLMAKGVAATLREATQQG